VQLVTSGYSAAQLKAVLHGPVQTWDFRYDLLDKASKTKSSLSTVLAGSCQVTNNTTGTVRRTVRFSMNDDPAVSFDSDRIRPWARLLMPDRRYAEWPAGTFLLSTPAARLVGGAIQYDVEGYDLGQVLQQDKVLDRYAVPAGMPVTTAVSAVLSAAGLGAQNVQASLLTLPATREWALGTTRAQIVSDLLAAINYGPLWFDALGVAQVLPFVPLSQRPVDYTYANDSLSVLLPGMQRGTDYFNVPNVFVAVVSQSDRPALRSVYSNDNPESPTSTARRGRQIVAVDTSAAAVDQATLDAYVHRQATLASQVYEIVPFSTGLMPFHGDSDTLQLMHSTLGVSALYSETSWSMQLRAGGAMQHSVQRMVTV
jgi:hypothetical protein